jgi:hypothetical protein
MNHFTKNLANLALGITIILLICPAFLFAQDGLVAHWTFDEGEGTTVADKVSGYIGEFRGNVEFDAGKVGSNSLYFNGVDAWVQTDLLDDLKTAEEFTMAAWFNTEVTGNEIQQHMLWIGDSTGNGWGGQQETHISINHFAGYVDKLIFAFGDGADTDGRMVNIISEEDFFDVNEWHHIASVVRIFDGDTSRVTTGELYLDGQLLTPFVHEFPTREIVYDEILRDGWNMPLVFGQAGNGQRKFVGMLDDVQIYNKALTAEEIASIMAGDTAVETESPSNVANEFQLHGNYPNPFNPSTTISYSLHKSGFVNLKIYNLLGEELEVVVSDYQYPGVHTARFDASNLTGGIYFYTLQVDATFSETRKMVLVK